MRLFIAFDVSEEAKNYLSDLQKQLPEDSKLNLVKQFHQTLKFLGDVDEDKIDKIKAALTNVSFTKFTAKTNGLGVFPDEKMIRVVWVGLVPKDAITGLQQEIETALLDMFPKDTRFHPHLTLARVKSVKDKKDFIEKLNKLTIKEINFPVSSFKLIKSELTPEGPVYEDIAEFSLNPQLTQK
ncbi:RNA 2',3'-cyclic phosphodiesterase [Candidatus Woesearchaeota archaeon]|nr:RNA 2',3'-cyclic phosphodiesterase [Candidatus Woesearchaeota archaeon]MBW3006159.1 RNA 2',3'-cyclic phosphodiesterase [Candidatus Woesearchaeota archaeon]